jgi:hypothetical protein
MENIFETRHNNNNMQYKPLCFYQIVFFYSKILIQERLCLDNLAIDFFLIFWILKSKFVPSVLTPNIYRQNCSIGWEAAIKKSYG